MASERRSLLEAVMERLERRRLAVAIAVGACGVVALALVAFLYSNKPETRVLP